MRRVLAAVLALLLAVSQVQAGFLINSFSFAPSAATPTKSFQACATDTSDLTNYSFASQAIGTASATRNVFVVVGAEDSATSFTLSSATIAGVAATIHLNGPTTGATQVAIISAAVSSGTTGTIDLTFSEAITAAHICTTAVYDLSSVTPVASSSARDNASGPLTLDLNTSADGVVIAGCTSGALGQDAVWTGLSEDTTETSAEFSFSPASLLPSLTSTPLAVVCNFTGTGDSTGAVASFR